MREAFLTGDTDATEIAEVSNTPLFWFESVTLTEDGHLKLTGSRFAEGASDEFTITRSRFPHADLLKELRRLNLHMVLLTEHVSEEQLYPPAGYHDTLLPPAIAARLALRDAVETGEAFVQPLLEPFRCLSVAWKPKGVVLSGTKKTRYRFGKDLEMKTPLTLVMRSLDDEVLEENDYAFFEQMGNTLDALKGELIAYMNGKYGEGGEQLELFGKDAPAPTLAEAFDVLDEALHADQLRRDAREQSGQLFGGLGALGRIHDLVNANASGIDSVEFSFGKVGEAPQVVGKIEKRPAKRMAVKGGQQDA